MKRSMLILLAILLNIGPVKAQFWTNQKTIKGNGEMTSERRSTQSYDRINLVGSIDVELVSGKEGELQVTAERNLLEHIITEVRGGTLKIAPKDKVNLEPSRKYAIKVTVPVESLQEVSVTGSGDLWSSSTINASQFSTSLTGSGTIRLDLDVTILEGLITGSGDTHLTGRASRFSCKVTGSGDFNAFELEAPEVKATVTGSGDIKVHATNSLKANVLGSGDIRYKGNPDKQDFRAMGSGEISSH